MAMRGAQDVPRERGPRRGVSEALAPASAHHAFETDGITKSLPTERLPAEIRGRGSFVNWRGELKTGHLGVPALTQERFAEDDLADVRRSMAALGEGAVA